MKAKTSSSSSRATSIAPGLAGKLTRPARSGCSDTSACGNVSTRDGGTLARLGDVGAGVDVHIPALGRNREVPRHGGSGGAGAGTVGADGLQRLVDRPRLRAGAFVDG